MRRVSRFNTVITSRISKVSVAVATLMTAALVAFGGLSPVGAQATGTYQCGTYGGGNYNETDCTDPTPTPTTNSTPSQSTNTTSTNNSTSSTSSTSSSSSTSTTKTTTTAATPILLNDFTEYVATTGKVLGVTQGQVINFNLKGEKHTITVKSISSTSLILTVASTPTDVTVPFAQAVSYDVDKDGVPDIEFTYKDFATASSTANTVFRSIAATSSTSTPTATTGTSSNSSPGGITETQTNAPSLWWVWIIPIVIGVGLLIWAIIAAKRRKANANNGNVGSSNFQF